MTLVSKEVNLVLKNLILKKSKLVGKKIKISAEKIQISTEKNLKKLIESIEFLVIEPVCDVIVIGAAIAQ